MEIITKYFKDLTPIQIEQFGKLYELYADWNAKINVVSRKDFESLYEKHVLHSLGIAKYIQFEKKTRILDLGTGGGFPGIPLAILFPEVQFTLCDSIAKKIKVAEEVSIALDLKNTDFVVGRVEDLKETFDFVVSRAVAPLSQIYQWTQEYIDEKCFNSKINGYLLLKGGDLYDEIKDLKAINGKFNIQTVQLKNFFEEEFFETKKLVYVFKN